ncbi:hypothetical protein SUGI_0048380 [Cryptomeria japonica]|nr:hypothetical protein SUGI_0048380 [Cryptomeria japonica]
MTVESNAYASCYDKVTLSQLKLIGLAGSESSKTEATWILEEEHGRLHGVVEGLQSMFAWMDMELEEIMLIFKETFHPILHACERTNELELVPLALCSDAQLWFLITHMNEEKR